MVGLLFIVQFFVLKLEGSLLIAAEAAPTNTKFTRGSSCIRDSFRQKRCNTFYKAILSN
jgi:hypothetical protein